MNIPELLAALQTNPVLRERVALLVEDNHRLKEQIAALQKENAEHLAEISRLREQIAKRSIAPDCVEYQGVLFKGVSKGADAVSVECAVFRIDGRFQ